MLDMGFIHDLRKIVAHVPGDRQTLMFSATMPDPIRRLAADWLRKPVHVQVAREATTPDKVQQSVCFVEPSQKSQLLSRFLLWTVQKRTLVFTRTKRGADKVARSLRGAGIKAISIHGDKSQRARQSAIDEFRAPEPPVLVATDIAARGLDLSGISHVVNYDMPEVPETYIHRIGRTARAGASGCAISFCGCNERPRLKLIERLLGRTMSVQGTPRGSGQSVSRLSESRTSKEPAMRSGVNSRSADDGPSVSDRQSNKRKRKRPTSRPRKYPRRTFNRAN
jgi:ATP-dependent RNA helicase RhlE